MSLKSRFLVIWKMLYVVCKTVSLFSPSVHFEIVLFFREELAWYFLSTNNSTFCFSIKKKNRKNFCDCPQPCVSTSESLEPHACFLWRSCLCCLRPIYILSQEILFFLRKPGALFILSNFISLLFWVSPAHRFPQNQSNRNAVSSITKVNNHRLTWTHCELQLQPISVCYLYKVS